MKPISSSVSAPTDEEKTKSSSNSDIDSDERTSPSSYLTTDMGKLVSKHANSEPLVENPSPEAPGGGNRSAHSSTSLSSNQTVSDRMDKKLVCASRETSLSVFKASPLSMFVHNKVGSSFPGVHPNSQAISNYVNQQQQQQQVTVLPVTSRKVRDSGSLLFMLAFLGFLGYIIWDGVMVKESDVNLIVHGHDSYGNICGRNNRAIKFVEKSGQNLTSKPYTKYTLINAQFERYILDSDRFKSGELYYVKQSDRQSDRYTWNQTLRLPPKAITTSLRVRRSDPQQPEQRNDSPSSLVPIRFKSKLMYQYPPLYGYSPAVESDKKVKNSRGSTTDNAQVEAQESHNDPSYAMISMSAMSSRSLPPTPLNTPAQPQRLPAVNGTPSVSVSMFPAVVFDDDRADNSDRFEHILINPTSTNNNQRPRSTPNGLSHNEVSSQLFYLTECVDSCPADHVELIFFRCMPKNWRFSLFPNAINVTRTFIDEILVDVSHCYRELIYIFSFALVLSLAILILLRFLASVIIWTCLLLMVSLFISLASYSWLSYYHQVMDLNNLMPHDSSYLDRLASSDKWLVGAIFLTFVTFVAIMSIIFMRKRIILVTTLFRESGKAIADMPLLLLQPLLTFAALLAVIVIWTIGLICLQSMKLPVIDMSTGFVVFKAEMIYKFMKWYHVFAFLWVSHFVIACQHYVIGAAVSKWYFSTNRYNLHSPIGSSVSELILYYLGSVALGSFLVAIFKVIRIITRQIQYLVQRNCMSSPHSSENGVNGASMNQLSPSCCGSISYVWRLFIWFFDNIVMIISRDAYVEIAIHGHSFLAGAQQAITILSANPLRLLAIKSVSSILLVVAKVCVVFGTISMAVILVEEKSQQLNYSWSPIVISAMYSYVVAHWFLSVYEMVIDSLFICYCEDYERAKNQETNSQVIGSNFMAQILSNNQGHKRSSTQ